MIVSRVRLGIALLGFGISASAWAQTLSAPAQIKAPPPVPANASPDGAAQAGGIIAGLSDVQLLTEFRESEIKFALGDLMELLRDRRHEGWVLAAYPDPKTGRPLIGAGFSLDLPAREHPQRDPLNPHPFLEPSSAELWQAAGLPPDRLNQILDRFHERNSAWSKRQFRNRIRALDPDIAEEDANQLLRIAAIQAVYNARAYCRNFDQLTASQQMAMSQLVYQMGVNLEEFNQFLSLINVQGGPATEPAVYVQDAEYWSTVQQSLIHSQWARLYRGRAISVIAMLDPRYDLSPSGAERRVSAFLRPAVVHRHGRHAAASRQVAAGGRPGGSHARKIHARARSKRKA